MAVVDEKEYLKMILERNNIFNEIEKKHIELVDLIEKYLKLENDQLEAKGFIPLDEWKLLGDNSPKLIIETAYNQSIYERLEKLRPIDLKKDLEFFTD